MSSPRSEVNGMKVVDALLRQYGLIAPDEVWVHGMWMPRKWMACIRAKLAGKKLVRMMHGGVSPIYLERQSKLKKRIVKPIERLMFMLADRIVGTGVWEVEWAHKWGLKREIETIDLKRFFSFDHKGVEIKLDEIASRRGEMPLKVLYLGRVHALKGIDALRQAVLQLRGMSAKYNLGNPIELREVCDHFGDDLEADWRWADLLVLPTLSENFGLVVAEALMRGKPVITTDGAPAWEAQKGVMWLKGYCEGDFTLRVKLLRDSLQELVG